MAKTSLPSEWLEKVTYQEKLAEKNLKQAPISKVTTYTKPYGLLRLVKVLELEVNN